MRPIKEKLATWEKENEKYKEAKADADAEVAVLKSNCAKIKEEIVSLQNDSSRQSPL
jgi:chromosome segregation ATPase